MEYSNHENDRGKMSTSLTPCLSNTLKRFCTSTILDFERYECVRPRSHARKVIILLNQVIHSVGR